jgi:hypothetical protein
MSRRQKGKKGKREKGKTALGEREFLIVNYQFRIDQ